MKDYVLLGADFETDHNEEGTKAWVCQWAVSDGRKDVVGADLDSYHAYVLSRVYNVDAAPVRVYFHNLKYDSTFMYDHFVKLQEEGFEMNLSVINGSPVYISFRKHTGDRGRTYFQLIYADSMKTYIGPLKDVAKGVGMEKLMAPDSEFRAGWSKDIDYSNISPEAEDWKYVAMDARIVAVAMQKHRETYTELADGCAMQPKYTNAGSAFQMMQKHVSEAHGRKGADLKSIRKTFSTIFPKINLAMEAQLRKGYMGGINYSKIGDYVGNIHHLDVNSLYPSRMMYEVMPYGAPVEVNEVLTMEKVMAVCPLSVTTDSVKLRLKEDSIAWFTLKDPSQALKAGVKCSEPVVDTECFVELTLTNVDWELLEEWYYVEHDASYQPKTVYFHGKVGELEPYLTKFYELKNEVKALKGTPEYSQVKYDMAKVMMNSVYGRFALNVSNPKVDNFTSNNAKPRSVTWHTAHDNTDEMGNPLSPEEAIAKKMARLEEEEKTHEEADVYLPYAMFVTAYGRKKLLEGIKLVGPQNVIHCDTDSIVFQGDIPVGIEIDEMKLGAWDEEGTPEHMIEGGPKRYVEFYPVDKKTAHTNGMNFKCAGCPQGIKEFNGTKVPVGAWVELLDNPNRLLDMEYMIGHESYSIESEWLRAIYEQAGLNPDSVNTMKLLPKHVEGGVILQGTTFNMKSVGLRYRVR